MDNLGRIIIALTVSLVVSIAAAANENDRLKTIDIYTDVWLPYINEEHQPLSSDAKLLELVAKQAGYRLRWRYYSYGLSYDLVKRGKAMLSFPYFKTKDRAGEVGFSKEIFKVTSRFFYNRQFYSEQDFSKDLSDYRIGKVAGYSYGESVDKLISKAEQFQSEQDAIQALLNNDIDLLPLTEEVARATLQEHFPNRLLLLKPLNIISYQPASLHLIAPDTPEGAQILNDFNEAIALYKAQGYISDNSRRIKKVRQTDFAVLTSAEGYPVILGQTQKKTDDSAFYTLPDGTKAIVLEWSKTITEASHTDRLYKNMIDLSRVLILNGPHVGKELYVKNMHIRLN